MRDIPDSIHVLVADDEAALLAELQDFLSWNGLSVTVARDGAEALGALAATPEVTVVLTDIRMPCLDGLTLTSRILQGRGEADAIEVVLMTGHGSMESAAEAVRARAFDFLRKPMSLSETLAALRRAHAQAMQRRRAHGQRQGELARLRQDYAALQARLANSGRRLEPGVAAPPELAQILSHELRTPLVPLLALPELLSTERSIPAGEFNAYLRDVRQAGERLTAIAEDLIEFLAPPEPRALLWRPVSPDSVLTRLLARCAPAAREAGIRIEVVARADGLLVTDEARLVRALARLVSNACAVLPAEGGQIELSACAVASDSVTFAVHDNGPGMTPAEIELAMLPFRQLDMSLRRRLPGMGLGLPLAERMAQRLGGRLHIAARSAGGAASVGADEGTTERATTERATTERATTERATTEGATTEGATTEGATTEGGTTAAIVLPRARGPAPPP